MHILGLDFATKTGVALGYAGEPPDRIATETWLLPSGGGEDVGPIMSALRTLLYDRVIRGVELVVFEAPYIATGKDYRGRTVHRPDQIRRAFGFAAICEEVCHSRGVKAIEVAPSTLKKAFGGHGRAEKADMIEAARRRGFTVANDHEADAAACWLHGVAQTAPQLLQIYDPIFLGGRRG